ncbi:hypothetical protein ABH944_006245 [Caballeronia udeis]|uniref:hypothetical protein n=1 Tax=Caballeronia udeis TaxID=1232866 RepID=UPI0038352CB5
MNPPYYYCLRKIGITKKNADVCGHGLRAEFAENCAIARGLLPATLGGTADQMPKEEMDLILLQVSEKLGHSRKQIHTPTTVNSPSFVRIKSLKAPRRR